MNSFYVYAAFVLACFVATSEAIFDGGVVTVPAGALILGALGIKAIAGIGLLAKGRGGRKGGHKSKYGKRSIEDVETLVAEAAVEDAGDCAKKLICLVHAKAANTLDQQEAAVFQLFPAADAIDVSKDTVQFDLAAVVGRKAGAAACERVYRRCEMTVEQLKSAMRA